MARSTKKEETRGYYTAKLYIHDTHHPSIFVRYYGIGMVSCSFLYVCCVVTPVSSFKLSIHPFIMNKPHFLVMQQQF